MSVASREQLRCRVPSENSIREVIAPASDQLDPASIELVMLMEPHGK